MLTKMAALRITILALIALSAIHPSGGQVLTLPALNQESLPNTNFSCIGKVIGGYYADVFTGCQMFHVCTLDEKGEIHDYKFGCILGTVFDQETRVCERTDEVNCSESESFFHLNDELYGPGVIPPTADTAATSSAATVKVLDPAVALLAATISPPASTDTSTGPPPSAPANPSPVSSVAAAAPPHLSSQSIPTSSPPPPAIPQGVTASSDSSTSRMSTSTSSSVTSAYSFPPLPFTVSRTSTSVSASSRVRIETPLVQITLNQGIDLPAPHLRPSLLRLAAQSQNAAAAAQNFEDLNPTSPSPIRSRTPADFEDVPRDVPRLSHAHSSFRTIDVNPHSIVSSRQKRQTTPTRGRTFRRNRLFSTTDISETVASPSGESPVTSAPDINNQPITLTDSSFTRTTSRGRNRFRSPAPTPVSSSASGNPLRGSTNVQNILVDNTPVRQRGQPSRIRQNDNNTRLQSRVQEQSINTQPRRRPGSSNSRRRQEIPSTANQSDLSVQSQQDSPIEKTIQSQPSQPFSRVSFVRPQALPQVVTNRPLTHNRPVLRAGSEVRNPDISKPDTFTKTLTRTVAPIVRFDPLPLNDPTPLPPTVLTAELPPDSVHRVSEGATSGTNFPTTTQTAFVFPETSFLCHDKIPGGLYADVETGCVVFHICSVGPDSSVNDNKFVCGEGTLFDQTSRTCQIASAVDCSRSESLYYLNDRLKGPVFLELEPQLPEQQFDFPRVQSSPSSSSSSSSSLPDVPSHSRFRRNAEKVVDLCLSQPLGTPLADLTSGCQNYMICESRGDGGIFESHHSCKKDYLFSQIRKRCLPSKKVNCVKETLSGILGLDSSKRSISKKRVTRSLLLHRLRRAALPPLVNVVTNAGTEEDARVRRALYSLAILQRWALENARDTTFIEVYSLNTKNNIYPKKAYVESHHLNRYGYLQRKKRDNSNSTSAEQSLNGNQTKAENPVFEPASATSSSDQGREKPGELIISPTSTLPHILPTITIPPQTRKPTPANPRQKLRGTIIDGPSTSFNASPTQISLQTYTVNNTRAHTTTVTLPVATVTVTKTVNLGVQMTDNPIVNTALPELPQSPVEASTPLPISSATVTAVDLIGNMTNSTVNPDFHQTRENSTSPTHGLSTSKETVEIITPSAPVLSSTESSAESATSSSPAPQQDQVTETPVSVATNSVDNTTVSSPNSTVAPTVQSVPEDITTTPSTTTLQVETAITEASAEIANVTVSTNITTTTLPSITEVVPPSINASTTSLPSDLANNASMTPVTQAPAPTISPFTKDNLPETNFTCKGKKLEQFYPDTEANCQVFHYCSPGFQDTQILDLKFLCSGATMFDVGTQKCENKSMVPCGQSPKETPAIEKTPTTVNTTITEPPPSSTQASESPPVVVTMPTKKIEVDEKPTTTVTNTTTTEPPSNHTQASESPPVVVTTPTGQIEDVLVTEKPPTDTNTTTEPHHHNWNATSESPLVHNETNTTIAEAETLKPASNLPQTSENPPVGVTTPDGQIVVVLDTEKPPTSVSNTTTEPHHHNWNATSESPQVHNEESTNQTITEVVSRPPDEQIKVVPDVTTAESVTVVSDTEVSTVEIETVTARFPRDETTDSDMTTEFILEEDSPSTELGPMEVKSETMTASPVQASTTISAPLSPAAPLQISNSTISPPALNNTNISVSVLNNTTTEVNKNTNTETPL